MNPRELAMCISLPKHGDRQRVPRKHRDKKGKDWGQVSCSNKVGSPWWPTFSLPQLTAGKGGQRGKRPRDPADRSGRSPLSLPGPWFGPELPLVSSPGLGLGQRFSRCGQHPYCPRADPKARFASDGQRCFPEVSLTEDAVGLTAHGMCSACASVGF